MPRRADWIHPKVRTRAFAIRVIVLFVVLAAAMHWVAGRYRVGVSDELVQSLNHSWFLIDTSQKVVGVGEYVVFRIDRDLPPWPKGSQFVKKVAGVAGDRVMVGVHATLVNGEPVVDALDLLEILKKPSGAFVREEVVAPESLFVVGERPHSYDSRYWGSVGLAQVIGRGYPLW